MIDPSGRAEEAAIDAALSAGLRYVTDSEPGIRRTRRGRGFSYRREVGLSAVGRAERERINTLAIPPAWTDVWICADGEGHLQATGRDARGRKQYRYHDAWRSVRDEAKFGQLGGFGGSLPAIRASICDDLGRSGLPPRKVTALVLALMDRTLLRVGNESYRRANETFGLTTLEDRHVTVDGSDIELCFVGKGGRTHQANVHDRRLARAVRLCHELGGRELFTYLDPDGAAVRVDSKDCNEYLAEIAGVGTTVKSFRTWGATVCVLEALAERPSPLSEDDVVAAVDLAADRLGNTRAVCRRAYVHPLLTDGLDEEAIRLAWHHARATKTMSRAERATLHLLGAV